MHQPDPDPSTQTKFDYGGPASTPKIAVEGELPKVIFLSESPLEELEAPRGDAEVAEEENQLRIKRQLVVQLQGPMELSRGEIVELQWRSAEHGQTESMSSALRARVQLRAGESQPFKFKASDAPERDSSGKVSSRVKLISGKILREE